MAISKEKFLEIIAKPFPDADVELIDLVGDGDHYELHIKDTQFKDKSRIERHRMVNTALKDVLGDELHALTVKIKY